MNAGKTIRRTNISRAFTVNGILINDGAWEGVMLMTQLE